MKTITTHGTFEEAVAESPQLIKEICTTLRSLIQEIYPDVFEVPWPNQQIIGYGVGPKKNTEHFCYIGAHRKHVNLGFYYGATLSDPEGWLEGTGKNFRHIKIRTVDDLANPAIRHLIEDSVRERQEFLAEKE